MEIVRQQLGNGDKGEFRARQLTARRMLTGELDGADLEKYVEERLLTTTLDKAANWARGNAFMPATFGLACCAIEMMAAVNARMDIARFGFEAFRASPRQADLMIISGRDLDQDGPGRPPRLRPDARAQVGDRDGRLQLARWASSTTTRSSRPTSSCRSTSTSRAARRGPRRSSTGSSSCARWSWPSPTRAGAPATAAAAPRSSTRRSSRSTGRPPTRSTSPAPTGRSGHQCLTPPASS